MSGPLALASSAVDHQIRARNPRLYAILTTMAHGETWTVDGDEQVTRSLIALGQQMGFADAPTIIGNSNDITQVMGYIGVRRCIRMLSWMDEVHPASAFYYVSEARKNPEWVEGQILLDRLQAIQKIGLLGSVFGSARTQLIRYLLAAESSDADDDF